MIDKIHQNSSFTRQDVEVIESETAYQGFFRMNKVTLRHRLFEGGWSSAITREVFVRGHAVAAVMYDPDNDLIGLVEQFRIGALQTGEGETDHSPWLYEVVAGMTKPREEPAEVIERELQEEADMVPNQLISICDYMSSPGGSDESLSLFCALGNLASLGGIHGLPEEGENIRVVILPALGVFDQLYGGQFNNAATLICLQWLQLHREQLREGAYDPP